jgi:5-methylcytosine-specific restriction endonuclease McrA
MCSKRFCHNGRRKVCSSACANKKRGRRRHGRRKIRREVIFERDGYVCWLCDQPCDAMAKVPDPLAPTVDHITPRSRGGDDEDDNLACAHFICNSRRQDSWSFPVAS